MRLAALLGQTIDAQEAALAIRDITIAELQGQIRSQAESFGDFRAAYAAQGERVEKIDEKRKKLAGYVDEISLALDKQEQENKATATDLVRITTDLHTSIEKMQADGAEHADTLKRVAIRAETSTAAIDALQVVFDDLAGDLGQVRADGVKHAAELGTHVNTLDQAQTVRVQAIREKIVEDLTAMHTVAQEAIMEARGEVVSMFGQAHNERAEAETNTIARLVAVESGLQAIRPAAEQIKADVIATLDRNTAMIEGLAQRSTIAHDRLVVVENRTAEQAIERDGLAEQIKDVAASVETLTQRSITAIEHQVKTLRTWIASVDDDAQDAFNNRAATIEAAANELAVRVDQIEKNCDLVQVETTQQIAGMGEQLVQTRNTLTGDVAGVRSALQELRERLRSTVSTLPKSLLVDTDGDLVAIDGNGDPQRIGKVMGKRGRNGAELLDAEMRDGCLVLRMTDGRKVVTENLLLQVVQEVQGTVVGNLQKAGIPDKQIAALFGKQPARSQRAKNEGQVKEPAPRRAARSKQPDLDRAGKQ